MPANMNFDDWKNIFVQGGAKDGLTVAAVSGIMKPKKEKSEGSAVQTAGRIDIEKYRCITDDITTDEVIITDERIQHIEERHPGAYGKIKNFLQMALDDPDYILRDEKNPDTGIILKQIEKKGVRFQMVLRVHTSTDPDGFKNSIISGWDIRARLKNGQYAPMTGLFLPIIVAQP